MIICKIDNSKHETVDDMHAHLRKFKIKIADYYLEYEQKKDLLTGEQIPFKNYDQYVNQDFVNKNNLKKWLKTNKDEGKLWAINWLKKRKEEKSLIYAPSYVELKSLGGPSMDYFNSVGSYYNIAKEIGFSERYVSEAPLFNKLDKKCKIISDTREQNPLNIAVSTVVEKVDVGDYSLSDKFDKNVRIERKSISDFAGTLNARKISRVKNENDSSLERFRRELQRAKENNLYVVMLVESKLSDALSLEYLPQMKWSKVTSAHVFKNLRDLLNEFPLNFQVVFVDGRIEASRILIKIFEMGEQVKKIDLQNLIEKGLL